MIPSVTLATDLRDRGLEAERLRPPGATMAVVDWPLPGDDEEDAVPPQIAVVLSRALCACGRVAFLSDVALPGAEFRSPRRPGAAERAFGGVRALLGVGHVPSGVAIASDPMIVVALFRYGGWSVAQQAAIVFDPDANVEPVLRALPDIADWRDRALPTGVRLLLGPGHDGAFAVVAASTSSWMDRFTHAL